ncbi:hypothetical protein GCM10027169_27970 [Gordonia jinhuaensis]|uniref:Uncharacterized protein n=1 Tax=Gordonia jinhuaensis TaxID=1517702 RepID=A0A916T9R4_9ACTN|nr:hypothetical protein [Gordonia jinhuaensis]GGB37091.1 hypothetical protein GCM10011489_26160 [Gordonia jinhuaensis]
MSRREQVSEILWGVATFFILVIRVVSTLVVAVCVIAWVVVAVTSSLNNDWLWPAIISAIAVLVSTYLYSFVKGRH